MTPNQSSDLSPAFFPMGGRAPLTVKPALRAVQAGEAPQRKRRSKTVTQAAKDGSMRDLLVAMRDRTATAVENPNTPARELAALTKRLMEIARDIEAIDAREGQEAKQDASQVADGVFDSSAV